VIPPAFLHDLVARVDIVDIVGRHVQLKKGGANLSGLCPFHAEKSPSFTVSPSKQFYHCFGCGANGDAIRFLTEYSGMSFIDAVKELAGQVGMTAEATHWMLDQGIKVMGIDAITFDPPVWAMFERKQFWEAHRVMCEREYYHLENMTNLDQLPGHGFKLAVFPVKWVNTTAAPVRAVAIMD